MAEAGDSYAMILDGLAEMVEAGVLLVAEGLQPWTAGVSLGGRDERVEGTAAAPVSGFALIQVSSLADAVEWGRRLLKPGARIEVRPVLDAIGLEFTPELLRVA
jgi:hypothetical protein